MHSAVRHLALGIVMALLLGTTGALAQGEDAAPPAEVAPSEAAPLMDLIVPGPSGPPAAEQPSTEILDTVRGELENVLGPLPVLRCGVTAIGTIPLMPCEAGDR